MFSGLFSLLFGVAAVVFNDGSKVLHRGFFDGYDSVVWLVVILQVRKSIFSPWNIFFFLTDSLILARRQEVYWSPPLLNTPITS